nr:uncharacterized protein LOC124806317 [Hydra vulgaris]
MFNQNDDIAMNDRLDEVMYLQNDVSAIKRVENSRRRNGRNRLRRDEINHLQNERNKLNRDNANRRQNERRAVGQVEAIEAFVVKMSLLEGGDRRRYNLPSHDEVAVVFIGEDGAPPTSREVVIYPRGHPLIIVSSMSANSDPMVYPLFFPRGDAGWHNQLVHNPERATLQYAVDAYVKIEGQHLVFIRNNQNKLRSEQYDALHEHINNIANDRNIRPGRVVVLPSSYVIWNFCTNQIIDIL